MTIGERIRLKRMENGWTQRELARRMGYSHHSTLARIETNQVDVSQTRIVQFAEVLGVSVAYLMGWDVSQNKKPDADIGLSEKRQALIDFARTVPEDKAELVLRVIQSIVEGD